MDCNVPARIIKTRLIRLDHGESNPGSLMSSMSVINEEGARGVEAEGLVYIHLVLVNDPESDNACSQLELSPNEGGVLCRYKYLYLLKERIC